MSTIQQNSSQQYVEFDEYIDFQLQKTRSSIKWTDMLTAAAGVIVLVLGYLLVFVMLDHWVVDGGFGTLSRVLMLSAILLGATGWVIWKVVMPYLKRVSSLFAAQTLEVSDPQLKSSLLNLVDLSQGQRDIPEHIREAMEKRAATTLAKVDVEEAVDRRPLLRLSYILLGIVIVGSIYTLFSPKKPWSSLHAALLPAGERSYATRTQITDVRPGDVEVLARTTLEVTAFLHGEIPESVTLHYTTEDKKFVDEPIEMRLKSEETKEYRCILSGENGRGLLQNMTYRIAAGDAQSSSYHITVKHPPSATVQQVSYRYPKYMELAPRTIPTGHIDGWEGTTVTLKAIANKPIARAELIPLDREEFTEKSRGVPLPIQIENGTQLTLTWKLDFRPDGSAPHYYAIQCFNKAGETDPSPMLYKLNIRADKAPVVDLIEPSADFKAPANAIVPLIVKAFDPDFKLSYITLRAEKEGEELFGTPILFDGSVKKKRRSFSGTFDWKLEDYELKPGDQITFWVEARDNKLPLPNHKNSLKLRIRIIEPVSKEEAKKNLEEEKQQQQERLEQKEAEKNEEEKKQDAASEQEKEIQDDLEEKENEKKGDPDQKGKKEGDSPNEDGNEGDKKSDKGKKQNDSSEEKKDGGDSGKTDPQGNKEQDDDTVLQKLIEKFNKNHEKKEGKEDSSDKKRGDQQKEGGKKKNDPSGKKPSDNKQNPDGSPQEQKDNSKKKEEGDKENNKEKGNNSSNNDPSKDEEKGRNGNKNKDGNKKDGSGDKDNSEKMQGNKSDDSSKENSAENKNGDDKKKPEGDEGNPPKDDNGKKGMGDNDPEQGGKTPAKEETPKKMSDPGETKGGQKSPGKEDGKKSDSSVEDGKETPSESDKNAQKKKAKGDEMGEGVPDKDPNATQANKPDQIKNKDGKKPETTEKKGDGNPKNAKQKKGDGNKPSGQKQKDSDKKSQMQEKPSSPKGQPQAGNKPPQGGDKKESKKGGGDKTSKGGKEGSKSSKKPGGEKQGSKKGGDKPGGKKGKGGESKGGKKGGDKKGGGKKGGGQSEGKGDSQSNKQGEGQGKSDSKKQDGKGKGAGSGKAGSEKKPGDGQATGGASSQGGTGSEAADSSATPDKADLEHAKKATDLALKQLEDELQRGKVDEQLLKELGWSEEKMKKFAERMRKQLDKVGKANDLTSKARERQFLEMLKNLDMKKGADFRKGSNKHTHNIDSYGNRRLPVPAEYREIYEAYTRDLAKEK